MKQDMHEDFWVGEKVYPSSICAIVPESEGEVVEVSITANGIRIAVKWSGYPIKVWHSPSELSHTQFSWEA